MTKPRVFISHSAREPDAAAVRDAIHAALVQSERFRVFLDRESLQAGALWRSQINHWLGLCDAAVVVLSPSALDSAYVAYELALLNYRFQDAADPRLIPVLVDPVTAADVRANARLAPTRIAERQILAGDPATVGAAVLARLGDLAVGANTPVDRRAGAVAVIIDQVEAAARQTIMQSARTVLLEEVERRLGRDAADELDADYVWLPGASDDTRRFAMQLMRAGVEMATRSVRVMRNAVVAAAGSDQYDLLVDLVASSWVDHRSVQTVPEIANGERPRRTLALNAARSETARLYVDCARASRPVPEEWYVAECTGAAGEEGIVGPVGDALTKALAPDAEEHETLDELLDAYDANRIPVIVALPGDVIGELDALRAKFPTVTFFFFLGEDATPESAPVGVAHGMLVPGLDRGQEDTIGKLVRQFRVAVKLR